MTDNNKCILPWIHIHGDVEGKYRLCCYLQNQKEKTELGTSEDSYNAVWNGNPMKHIRSQYINNEIPRECYLTCHSREAAQRGTSFRTDQNKKWVHKHDLWDKTNPDGSVDVPISYFDIRFSNVCNFRCRMCGPESSTKWYNDWQKLTGKTNFKGPHKNWNKPALWDDIPTFIDNVEEIYFAGGEPLMMDEHYELLEYLISNGYTNLRLTYNTNLSVLRYKEYDLPELWSHFNEVELWPSMDGMGKEAEYSRKGLNWDQFEANCLEVKQYITTISSVINIYSIHSMLRLIDWCKTHDIFFNGTLLYFPNYLSIQCLPIEEKRIINKKYKEYLSIDKRLHLNEVNHILVWLKFMNNQDNSHLLSKFKNYTDKLDSIRNENFIEVFPYYEHWFKKI